MLFQKKICLWKKDKCNLAENILVILCSICAVCFLLNRLYQFNWLEKKYSDNNPLNTNHAPEITLNLESETSRPTNVNCKLWNCLNIYRCGNNGHDRLTIYVYPIKKYVDAENGKSTTLTREYYQIIDAVVNSHHYCSNPNEACLFLPTIDILNQQNVDANLINRAFASLDYWERGDNHILFSMIPSSYTGLNNSNKIQTDHAIVLDGGLSKLTYRPNFDVALPAWSPELQYFEQGSITSIPFPRKYVLISSQVNIFPEIFRQLHLLAKEHPRDMLILHTCKDINNTNLYCNNASSGNYHLYPEVLGKGTFCLITRTINRGIPNLLEMLAYNCIPVIAVDHLILPFEDVLDWSLAAVRIRESEVHALMYKLNEISALKIFEMQTHGLWLYSKYFKDLKTITLTALQILEDRIFPHRARSLIHWNTMDNNFLNSNPLFLPTIASKTKGFTAVILTFDRVESLFTLITKMSIVPSLYSILVIWNNQHKAPPPLSTFPITSKSVKIIQTRENKLSNRFFPYSEIETEAVLTIDDDILMLTADELDFGFEVWREFPDRIVGFPSRIHIWNNESMQWQYESEWTNQISMVLTGASFHHKIWNHLYTYNMPIDIKNWVDDHMNCEDIAMNFLVANVTKKAPIKVTPRKKFKCPECVNTEMLSADLNHMRERSSCIDRFAKIYGHMPLRSVEFRADPVLYLDNFPEKLKRFNDVGIL